jgi:hypothetical protein
MKFDRTIFEKSERVIYVPSSDMLADPDFGDVPVSVNPTLGDIMKMSANHHDVRAVYITDGTLYAWTGPIEHHDLPIQAEAHVGLVRRFNLYFAQSPTFNDLFDVDDAGREIKKATLSGLVVAESSSNHHITNISDMKTLYQKTKTHPVFKDVSWFKAYSDNTGNNQGYVIRTEDGAIANTPNRWHEEETDEFLKFTGNR